MQEPNPETVKRMQEADAKAEKREHIRHLQNQYESGMITEVQFQAEILKGAFAPGLTVKARLND